MNAARQSAIAGIPTASLRYGQQGLRIRAQVLALAAQAIVAGDAELIVAGVWSQ